MDNFVITIARQYGSGGRTIGEELAKKLGISYYDKDIIRMASEESGIHEQATSFFSFLPLNFSTIRALQSLAAGAQLKSIMMISTMA